MAEDKSQINPSNPTPGAQTTSQVNVSAPSVSPATATSSSPVKDEYLDLDSIYNLDADTITTKTQTTLSANAPVPTANLESFRAQSGAAVADGALDNQILADLVAKSKNNVSTPVVPSTEASMDKEENEIFDINSLKNLVPAKVVSPVASVDSVTPVVSSPSSTSVPVEVDLDALVKTEVLSPVVPLTPVVSTVKPVSEAAKIEAELEANTIDLDADLKDDSALPDLFESPSVATAAAIVDMSGTPKLSKIKLTKSEGVDEKRVVTAQKLMKTDTIYHRSDKKELNLSAALGDKKLKSPVEELAELTLEDWSRLGDIPSERAAKIKEKIASLGAKSIISEVEGLNAWRRSQTHQVYLDLGIAAMLSEKSLEETVDEQKDLNLDEWFTINQLNRELMI